MADDGLLLNFSIPDGPLIAKTTFKGGRWRDRVGAKRAASYRENKIAKGLNEQDGENENGEEFPTPREAKRQKTEGQSGDGASVLSKYSVTKASGGNEHAQSAYSVTKASRNGEQAQTKGAPKQVVSSLFTFNPVSTSKPEKEEPKEEEDVQPSNAPLDAALANFTSLGVTPSIASHLLQKLYVKAPTAIQKAAIPQLLASNTDAFIQAETGSGKTLAYLLPIVQKLVQLSSPVKGETEEKNGKINRHSGLFAIILAPTRELSKQISAVLENLLRCANWLVPGIVIGGESKKSEKARLRKGLNILVATPGRLVDHLENTEALDVSNVRWLVLDEGDRLTELGFEHDIQKIVGRLNLQMKKPPTAPIPALPRRRQTLLCSATMKMDVQRLGEISLKEATHIQPDPSEDDDTTPNADTTDPVFSAPAQLKQSYAVVPAKLRLVTLMAVLRRAFARKGSVMKAIVFMSCADSVDFHFDAFRRNSQSVEEDPSNGVEQEPSASAPESSKPKRSPPKSNHHSNKAPMSAEPLTHAPAPSLCNASNPVTAYRLHGSLPQAVRTSTLSAFTKSKDPSILVCTDVASRGLDLPNVDLVIEYDPAFSKDDHLHRIGRTARAGAAGRSLVFLLPGEEEGYVDILKEGRRDGGKGLTRHDADDLLKKGFGGTVAKDGQNWRDKATDAQLSVERWVLETPASLEKARNAFQSHVRAYATHVAAERHMFNIKSLHLGHLAKAFGLRDRPGGIKVPGLREGAEAVKKGRKEAGGGEKGKKGGKRAREEDAAEGITDVDEARRKMRAMGRMLGKGGVGEFNLG